MEKIAMISITEQDARLIVYHLRQSSSLIEAQDLADKIEKQLQPKKKNHCDWGHTTNREVRLLPIGDNANIICCIRHYSSQIQSWKRDNDIRGREYTLANIGEKWNELKVYNVEE
jgi:hypothetical protein